MGQTRVFRELVWIIPPAHHACSRYFVQAIPIRATLIGAASDQESNIGSYCSTEVNNLKIFHCADDKKLTLLLMIFYLKVYLKVI